MGSGRWATGEEDDYWYGEMFHVERLNLPVHFRRTNPESAAACPLGGEVV